MSDENAVTVKMKLVNASARLPEYKTSGAAGCDLSAAIDSPVLVQSGRAVRIPTGVQMEIPSGYEGQVRPRSGLSSESVLVTFGTIDSDFRGEVCVGLINLSPNPYTIKPNERIAQLVFSSVARAAIVKVAEEEDLQPTERGAGGFGSTGRV